MIRETWRLLLGRPDPGMEVKLALLDANATALGKRAGEIAGRLGLDAGELSKIRVPIETQMLLSVPVLEKILDRIEAIERRLVGD